MREMIYKIRDAIWFVRISSSFVDKSVWDILMNHRDKIREFIHNNSQWRNWTPEQREAWYLSGEGRLMEFDI